MTTATIPARTSRGRVLLAALVGTRTAPAVADVALIVARATLAVIFIYHGSRRLFGSFGGAGLDSSARYFEQVAGLSPGHLFATLSGLIELGGGIAIALGLLTRLAGLGIFVDMMMAIVTVTWSNGINATGGKAGYELNLALGVLALVLACFGAGRFSLDALAERRFLGGGGGGKPGPG
jgi:putative oxidoreductase